MKIARTVANKSLPLRKSRIISLASAVLLSLCLFNSGCGGSAPKLSSSEPPFNTSKGEGNLLNSQVAMTYATATTPSQAGLDSFYTNLICPTTLTTQDCATNKSNLDTAEFGNFDLASNPIANNPSGVQQTMRSSSITPRSTLTARRSPSPAEFSSPRFPARP
jgi:hypothetical protein